MYCLQLLPYHNGGVEEFASETNGLQSPDYLLSGPVKENESPPPIFIFLTAESAGIISRLQDGFGSAPLASFWEQTP